MLHRHSEDADTHDLGDCSTADAVRPREHAQRHGDADRDGQRTRTSGSGTNTTYPTINGGTKPADSSITWPLYGPGTGGAPSARPQPATVARR